MEHNFADLLSDAFSETAVPSFSDGDLDFENILFDDKCEKDETDICEEKLLAEEDEALQQEATGQTAVVSCMQTQDIYAEDIDVEKQCDNTSDNEDFEGVGVRSSAKILEEDYTSSESEQEGSISRQDEEGEAGDIGTGSQPQYFLRSVRCSDEFCVGNKEDRVFAEGQPLALEGAENPKVRKEEQGEGESDEEVSYFERVPERSNEMMLRGEGMREEDEQERVEETEEDLCDCECEGMTIEQEENILCFEQEFENPCRDQSAKASLEFPAISGQNLKDLIAEVNVDEYGEKMKEFSGEEHQDAGEGFADYPSDFSSCEYVEDEGKRQESNALACESDSESTEKQKNSLLKNVTDVIGMGKAEDTDEEGCRYLYSRDSEVYECRRLDVAIEEKEVEENMWVDAAVSEVDDEGETGENDSYTSSDDYVQEKRSDEELFDITHLQELESIKKLELTQDGDSEASSDEYNREESADFNINWNIDVLTAHLSEDLLTTEDIDEVKTPYSDVIQHPAAKDINSDSLYHSSVVQGGNTKQTTSPSNRGSLDDDFFFNTEAIASEITEPGQLGEDEYEEERYWDEQERIKAFNEFYDVSDEDTGRTGRQIKVQFCANPLSQVIHYETDECSDRDSASSSTEGEEDLSSAETSEVCVQTQEFREPDVSREMTPACDALNTQPPETMPDISDTHICTRKQKCFNVLKLTLKMCVVILTGLLMFWFASDQAGWFNHVSFF
ncbi:hypothetical protein PBY51_000480 [Eleginops maclovinus]|uniref:Uncharacterized protein n=1 Tax=Eleginops maclovinus TaxID=56733 RepID=A0AAN7XMD9_ELEMC|nr:hypothetical protein PBY51_000480 [Eleginops maclovinus]